MMITNNDYDIVSPAAGPMIESMRAHGYSPATAIADIIDNSISAGAGNIWMDFHWSGARSHIAILDDGNGMEESVLRDAMRPGSKSPLEHRDPKDLGRFGLGLKTASFSQCRRLTVASRTKDCPVNIRRWDLDHVLRVNEWQLLKVPAVGSEHLLTPLEDMRLGTLVIWENIDRIVSKDISVNNDSAQNRFFQIIQEIESYLSMVFHRYLQGPVPLLQIFINGKTAVHSVRPWDPFMEGHPATIKTPVDPISHPNGNIKIQGFVLPHKDKMTTEDFEYASGWAGWSAQQGFYVYRNRRLLVGGGWLGLGIDRPWTQEEQYRLARILVDIPNSQDMEWQIDVKKSTAKPPVWLRDRLRALADQVRRQAREVFAHRGSYTCRGPKIEITRAWRSRTINGRLSYRIDREHPLVKAISAIALTQYQKNLIDALLRTLEETIPAAQIWLDTAEKPEVHSRPFETANELEKRRLVEITYRAWREIKGLNPTAARQKLLETDGFQDFEHIIEGIRD